MTTLPAPAPFPYFTDTSGTALDGGKIYIGTAGLDPRTNPIVVYQDAANTIAWAQPLRTVSGYPTYQGAASNFYPSEGSFSILITDVNGAIVTRNLNVVSVTEFAVQEAESAAAAAADAAIIPYVEEVTLLASYANSSATNAANSANAAAISAAFNRVLPTTPSALPYEISGITLTAAGTGGTANGGPYALGISGASGAAGTYRLTAGGAVDPASITLTNRGVQVASTALTITFPSGGVTGATATATMSAIAVGTYFYAPTADGLNVGAWGNNAGSLATAPFGLAQLVIYDKAGVDAITPTRYFETLDLTVIANRTNILDSDDRLLPYPLDAATKTIVNSAAMSSYYETLDLTVQQGALLDGDGRVISAGGSSSNADAELAAAAGTRVDLAARLNVGLTPYGSTKSWLKFGHNLRQARRLMGAFRAGDAGTQMRWLGIGDSYTDGISYWSSFFSSGAWGGPVNPGYSGPGWIGFGSSTGASGGIKGCPAPWLYSCTRTGTWADAFGSEVHSPDICGATSSTVGDTYTITSVSSGNPAQTSAKLFYKGGSGSVQYRWNGGSWNSLSLSSGSGLQIATLTGLPATATWTLEVQIVSGSSSLFGLQLGNSVAGVQFYKCAATGRRIQERAAANATSMATALASFAPNFATIGTPINDRTSGRTPAQFYADLNTIIDQLRAYDPMIDILLFCPAEISLAYPYSTPMIQYAAVMEQASYEKGCGFIDFQPLFGADPTKYNSASSFPLLASDGVHPSIPFGSREVQEAFNRAITQG